jgi:hypothetical protein
MSSKVVNGIEIEDRGYPHMRKVNGRIAGAVWMSLEGKIPPGTRRYQAVDDVLDRAVELACMAYPEQMKNFHCRMNLGED